MEQTKNKKESIERESENLVLNTILNRRSIREYSDKKISKKDIIKILKAGHFAPSPKNSLPWYFVVIQNKNIIRKIMTFETPDRPEGENMLKLDAKMTGKPEIDKIIKKSCNDKKVDFPNFIVAIFFNRKQSIFYDSKFYGNKNKKDYKKITDFSYSDLIGVGCAIQNMVLTAESLGINSCITGDLLEKGVEENIYNWLEVSSEEYQLVGGIRFGYPKSNKKQLFFRTPLENHVGFI